MSGKEKCKKLKLMREAIAVTTPPLQVAAS